MLELNKNMQEMNLNTICNDCKKLNNGCNGTTNKVYTGCVYRKTKTKGQEQDELEAEING